MLSRIKHEDAEHAYKVYMSDLIKGIFVGMGGTAEKRYVDLLKPIKIETRTKEEIVSTIKEKMKGATK